MKAIIATQYGGPEMMQVTEVPVPKAGPGQLLIRNEAIGVNFKDIGQLAAGPLDKLPFTPGVEAAGAIAEVGKDAGDYKVGDRVAYVIDDIGAYAEMVLVPAPRSIRLPDEIPSHMAAAICVNGMTAHYLLHEYYLVQSGTDVLIHGAAGGMGLILVQWAKHLGARVIGTVSTEEKAKLATEAGADDIIIYTKEDFVTKTKQITNGKGVELAIDGVAKPTLAGSLHSLANHGTAVVYGNAGGVPEPIPALSLIWGSYKLAGGNLFDFIVSREELLQRAEAVFQGVRDGWLKLKSETIMPLEDAYKAHELLKSRNSKGKIVLTPGIRAF